MTKMKETFGSKTDGFYRDGDIFFLKEENMILKSKIHFTIFGNMICKE